MTYFWIKQMKKDIPKYISISFIFLIGLVFLLKIFGDIFGNTILLGDQNWFMPIVWMYHHTGELIHPLMSPIENNPDKLLIWHGWLMPLIQGFLQPLQSYSSILLSGHLLAFITFVGLIRLTVDRFGFFVSLVIAPILGGVLLYQVGRPELLLSVILLLYLVLEKRYNNTIIRAFIISLLTITSPIAALLLVILLIIRYVYHNDISLKHLAIESIQISLLVPLFIFILTSIIAGMDPLDWISGLLAHGSIQLNRDTVDFLNYYLFSAQVPLLLLFLFPLIILFGIIIKKLKILGAVLVTVLVILIYYFGIRTPPTVYNIVSLFPLILIFYFEVENRINRFLYNLVLSSFVIISIAFTASAFRQGIYSYYNFVDGNTIYTFVKEIEKLPCTSQLTFPPRSYPFLLSASDPLSYLEPDIRRGGKTILVQDYFSCNSYASTSTEHYLLYPQASTGKVKFSAEEKSCQIYNNFHSEKPTFLGISIGNTYSDWSFVLYDMNKCKTSITSKL